MKTTRKAIGKSLRFKIFSRDDFTCRYCGRQSDVVPLQVDHIMPVSKGGTNDPENLLTACRDCNLGKGAKDPTHTAPTESDRLRMAQERNEQLAAAESAVQCAKARQNLHDEVGKYWCSLTGRDSVSRDTLYTVCSYVHKFGMDEVILWIEKAASRCAYSDDQMGRYVSGCRRRHIANQGEESI